MSVQVDRNAIYLYGDVGDLGYGEFFTVSTVADFLNRQDPSGEILVSLNSGGGFAGDGAAIYSLLSKHKGNVTIEVEGIAASAASVIAMAGDTTIMAEGAVMMIHDPQNITLGDIAAHSKTIEELEAYAASLASVYARKSGKSEAYCRAMMKRETWLTAKEAVAEGFADAFMAGHTRIAASFDYRAYAHAPAHLLAQKRPVSMGDNMRKILGQAQSNPRPDTPMVANMRKVLGTQGSRESGTSMADNMRRQLDRDRQ